MPSGSLSLWLQPEPVGAAELAALIGRLAAVHDTAEFAAHVTMLGAVRAEVGSALRTLGALADRLTAFYVAFEELACQLPRHRSVYLRAAPNPELAVAYEACVRAFGADQPAFEPHLSLQYSHLPLADKQRLAGGVGLPLPVRFRFDRLSLWHTGAADARRWRQLGARPLAGEVRTG